MKLAFSKIINIQLRGLTVMGRSFIDSCTLIMKMAGARGRGMQ